jgi:hypothetical protein
MIRKPIILAGLAVALLATPAFAQSSAPSDSSQNATPAQQQMQPQGSVSAPGAIGATPAAPANTTDQAPAKSPYSQGMAKPSTAGGSNGGNVAVNPKNTSGAAVTGAGMKTKHATRKQANCYDYAYQSAQMNNCLAQNQSTGGVNNMGSSDTTGATSKTIMQNGNRGTAPSANNPNGKGATTP